MTNHIRRNIINTEQPQRIVLPEPRWVEVKDDRALVETRPTAVPAIIPIAPTVIPNQPQPAHIEHKRLSELILIGRKLHPVCRESYVQKMSNGTWKTCALAAAYVARFGSGNLANFSINEMVWRFKFVVGYDMSKTYMIMPHGGREKVVNGVQDLIDKPKYWWSREGVAFLLWEQGL